MLYDDGVKEVEDSVHTDEFGVQAMTTLDGIYTVKEYAIEHHIQDGEER